jgi:hypothetical protein
MTRFSVIAWPLLLVVLLLLALSDSTNVNATRDTDPYRERSWRFWRGSSHQADQELAEHEATRDFVVVDQPGGVGEPRFTDLKEPAINGLEEPATDLDEPAIGELEEPLVTELGEPANTSFDDVPVNLDDENRVIEAENAEYTNEDALPLVTNLSSDEENAAQCSAQMMEKSRAVPCLQENEEVAATLDVITRSSQNPDSLTSLQHALDNVMQMVRTFACVGKQHLYSYASQFPRARYAGDKNALAACPEAGVNLEQAAGDIQARLQRDLSQEQLALVFRLQQNPGFCFKLLQRVLRLVQGSLPLKLRVERMIAFLQLYVNKEAFYSSDNNNLLSSANIASDKSQLNEDVREEDQEPENLQQERLQQVDAPVFAASIPPTMEHVSERGQQQLLVRPKGKLLTIAESIVDYLDMMSYLLMFLFHLAFFLGLPLVVFFNPELAKCRICPP